MELGKQIKKYRKVFQITQDDLAEKIFVSRQTISNWENDKSYPDIHSLILLCQVFQISIDELIQGDIEIMEKEILKEDVQKFNTLSKIYAILLFASVSLLVPLWVYLKVVGIMIWIVFYGVAMYYANRIEKQKKQYDIQTYKEITAFMNGEKLDVIQKNREIGKRPYQKIFLVIGCAIIGFAIAYYLSVWLM